MLQFWWICKSFPLFKSLCSTIKMLCLGNSSYWMVSVMSRQCKETTNIRKEIQHTLLPRQQNWIFEKLIGYCLGILLVYIILSTANRGFKYWRQNSGECSYMFCTCYWQNISNLWNDFLVIHFWQIVQKQKERWSINKT